MEKKNNSITTVVECFGENAFMFCLRSVYVVCVCLRRCYLVLLFYSKGAAASSEVSRK